MCSYHKRTQKEIHILVVFPNGTFASQAFLDYKSRMTSATICRYWRALAHNEEFKHYGPLLTSDDIHIAITHMNAQREACNFLQAFGAEWSVETIRTLPHSSSELAIVLKSVTLSDEKILAVSVHAIAECVSLAKTSSVRELKTI
jgi:hypothetical protein